MKVEATKSFNKDLEEVKDKKLADKIETVIRKMEKAETLSKISGIKKMQGSTNAYRCRIGEYRLGFYFNNNTIELTVFANRKDIYKRFP